MYSKERKRFPEELFLPGFPTRDNLQTGTEDSQPPLTIPPPDRPGGVLIPQLNPLLCLTCHGRRPVAGKVIAKYRKKHI